jgi:hypothetical protein
MPSLLDIAHDGWLCTMYIVFITAARNSVSSQLGSCCQGNLYVTEKADGTPRPSHTKSCTPAGSLSSSQPGGPPCWASPLAFGLTVLHRDGGHKLLISNGGRFKPTFAKRDIKQTLTYLRGICQTGFKTSFFAPEGSLGYGLSEYAMTIRNSRLATTHGSKRSF